MGNSIGFCLFNFFCQFLKVFLFEFKLHIIIYYYHHHSNIIVELPNINGQIGSEPFVLYNIMEVVPFRKL